MPGSIWRIRPDQIICTAWHKAGQEGVDPIQEWDLRASQLAHMHTCRCQDFKYTTSIMHSYHPENVFHLQQIPDLGSGRMPVIYG